MDEREGKQPFSLNISYAIPKHHRIAYKYIHLGYINQLDYQ